MRKHEKLILCLALIVVLMSIHVWLSQEIVLRSEPSPDGKKLAQISMRYNFPYISPDGYLTIKKIDGGIIARHHILARDVASEILDGVEHIAWRGEQILLFGDDRFFIGPDQYHPRAMTEATEIPAKYEQ